ncbi:MAG: type II toxin-antitoxin system VapB family antitoxin [Alphaproteobacteria bacterium]|nr:type II toxin-antitoxin system VapB family antitoxin [Alphaproteobacteria bacterium]
MRTNIVIDDRLMRDAMAASGARSKREAVELGLKLLLARRRQAAMRPLRGTLDWQGDLEAMRRDTPADPA